ncbi:SDR family NAD(P)-dependent oxidoreductase [Nonomuraea wenchangensis]|uniref:NAD(P)-dependent dehydrogenase, short-chain alcohol dehydrogenase family n=1 Tax=Nonomuraea wenchangensis TaxID=568860 RepID=A0A1I0LNX9_9ACTN|nr:SDR family NAD(P)-dependent oxidoreductase [Nonomuraea wenchangensis]SEU43158.1 NAD(P)-dependent dehydrogenase, short-chain alcohol dehydrogenase family [Nonomuraea wenchangensis]
MTEWAVVTGAAQGIGAVIAEFAVKAGYRVAAWDIDGPAVERTAAEIGDGCVPSAVDVADEESVRAAAALLPEPPRLVVNNAGIVRFGPLLDLPLAEWESALRVNLTGTFIVARTLAGPMGKAGGGAIVNLASVNGLAAAPHAGAYSASKAGIVRLTEHMAMEWARLGIRVNCVAPGLIHAGMSDAIYADAEVRRVREGAVPLARLGSAEDIAAAVLFLGSEKAGYVTGQTLAVDGGLIKSTLAALPRPQSVDSVGPGGS